MIQWEIKNFHELTKEELYRILKFRMEIFILEQKSFYLDLDDLDQNSTHFLGTKILEFINLLPDVSSIELDAQAHLTRFYEEHGFQSAGVPYDDGGILHINMVKKLSIAR